MKAKLLAALLLICGFCFTSQAKDYINYFQVSDHIAQPVRIRTNLGNYTFSHSYTLHGYISRIEAFDAYGNRIVNTTPKRKSIRSDKTKPDEYWYYFQDVYSSGSSYNGHHNGSTPPPPPPSNSYSGYSSYGYGYGSVYMDPMEELAYTAGATGVAAIAALFAAGAISTWDEHKTRLDLDLGYGAKYDGLGILLSLRTPSVFGITGGIGLATTTHDIYRYDNMGTAYADKSSSTRWYAAMQLWMMNGWNIEAGVCNNYFKSLNEVKMGLAMSTNVEIHISGPVAFYGGMGFIKATGNGGPTYFTWSTGLRFRLSAK